MCGSSVQLIICTLEALVLLYEISSPLSTSGGQRAKSRSAEQLKTILVQAFTDTVSPLLELNLGPGLICLSFQIPAASQGIRIKRVSQSSSAGATVLMWLVIT